MSASMSFHGVTSITFENCWGRWSYSGDRMIHGRDVVIKMDDGEQRFSIFADTADGLLLPHEREQERIDAERARHDDAVEADLGCPRCIQKLPAPYLPSELCGPCRNEMGVA